MSMYISLPSEYEHPVLQFMWPKDLSTFHLGATRYIPLLGASAFSISVANFSSFQGEGTGPFFYWNGILLLQEDGNYIHAPTCVVSRV